jgi:hypothetical protein
LTTPGQESRRSYVRSVIINVMLMAESYLNASIHGLTCGHRFLSFPQIIVCFSTRVDLQFVPSNENTYVKNSSRDFYMYVIFSLFTFWFENGYKISESQ